MASSGRNSSTPVAASSSAAEVVNSTEILSEILVRLPAKPVLKFKLVSKYWCSIISAPEFTVIYAKRNRNPHLGFMLHARLEFKSQPRALFLPLRDYQYENDPNFLNISKMEIHHVCNGLLCCSRPHLSSPHIRSYYICNHTSGKSEWHRVLASPYNETVKAFNVAFDPLKSPHYRLLFVRELSVLDKTRLIKIDVYSSETKSWRASTKGIYILEYDIGFHVSVYWKNAMYWYNEKDQCLAHFDFNDDSVEILPKPKVAGETLTCYYLGESAGQLHLVGSFRPLTSLITVYELQEDRSDWVMKYHGDFSSLAYSYPKMVTKNPARPYMFGVVNLLRGKKAGECIIVLIIPEGVISYNVRHRRLEMLYELDITESYMQQLTFRSHQYIETLASI